MTRILVRLGASLVVVACVTTAAACTEAPETARADRSRFASPAPDSPDDVRDRLGGDTVFFPADARAGDALTHPIEVGRAEIDPGPMDIYRLDGDRRVQRIIATPAHDRCPAMSPDGTRLSYVVGQAILVASLDADGNPGPARVLVEVPAGKVRNALADTRLPCPQWSPDGRRLAFVVPEDNGPGGELRAATLDGRQRLLSPGTGPTCVRLGCTITAEEVAFTWSPRGDAVAYTSAAGVWRAPLDGGASDLVWRPGRRGSPSIGARSVSWSSGNELAVGVLTDSGPDAVEVADLESRNRRLLERVRQADTRPAWSPDGTRLALVGADGHIRVHERATGMTTRLAPLMDDDRDYTFRDVTWSDGGGHLVGLAWSIDCQHGCAPPAPFGLALVAVAIDGSAAVAVTPWTWGLDGVDLSDVSVGRAVESTATSAEWPGPIRPGTLPVVSDQRLGPGGNPWRGWADPRDSEVDRIDIRLLAGWGLKLEKDAHLESWLDHADRIVEYGLVVDTDGDRVADCRLALSTDAPGRGLTPRDGPSWRVLLTNLHTGERDERVGPPYGYPFEFGFASSAGAPSMYLEFLGSWQPPCDAPKKRVRWYAYSSLTEEGQVTAWDFAPDDAWLETLPDLAVAFGGQMATVGWGRGLPLPGP